MAFQFPDCPALAARILLDRAIKHKEMPNEETMLASLENTGIDIIPAAVIPDDIPPKKTFKLFPSGKTFLFSSWKRNGCRPETEPEKISFKKIKKGFDKRNLLS